MEQLMLTLPHGIRIACHLSGTESGPPMVLLHGLGENSTSWVQVRPVFAEEFRVLQVDLRGHGDSDWPGIYSFDLMRDDVIAALDTIGLKHVVLVGHSMGGIVAYRVTQARPDLVDRLVVEDVPPSIPRSRPIPEKPDAILDFDWAVVPVIGRELNDPSRQRWNGLRGIEAPTLLIAGGAASHIPQDLLSEAASLISNSTLVTVPAGHDVHEDEPVQFSRTVMGWLHTTKDIS